MIDSRETKLMTPAEVAKQFGVPVATIYSWELSGCPCRKVNGTPMFLLKSVIRWKRQVAK